MSDTAPATGIVQVGEFEYSGDIGKLFDALAKAQALGLTAEANQNNPAFKRDGKPLKYADLDAVMEVFKEKVAPHGLSILSFPAANGKSVSVKTVLGHSSGAWMAGVFSAEAVGANAQNVAAAKTYLVRHNTCAITGITIGVPDDDGNEATGKDADGVSLPRGERGSMREHGQTVQSQRNTEPSMGGAAASDDPVPTRDAIPIWGADGRRYTAKPRGGAEGSNLVPAVQVWVGFFKRTLGELNTLTKVDDWFRKNVLYLEFVRQHWPESDGEAMKAYEERRGVLSGFPPDLGHTDGTAGK